MGREFLKGERDEMWGRKGGGGIELWRGKGGKERTNKKTMKWWKKIDA